MENKLQISNILTVVTTVIGILTAGFSLYLTIKFGGELKKLENESKKIDNDIKATQFVDKRVKESYDLVLDAIKSKDPVRISAAFHLINFTLASKTYDELRNGLIELIAEDQSLNSDLAKTVKKVQAFENEDQIQNRALASLSINIDNETPIRVDFFVLENSSLSLDLRNRVTELLDISGYNARARDLPKVINNRPGYNLTKNEIRHEPAELEDAKKVKQLLKSKFNLDFELNETSYPTSNYISVFFVR